MGETGISVVHGPWKVLAEKGKRKVGAVPSDKRRKIHISHLC